jgi:ABC-2 type transport system permease protein
VRLRSGLAAQGVSTAQANAAIHTPPVPVVALEKPKTDDTAKSTAFFGIVLLFVLLSQYGYVILSGVIEEKATRVVEVLLAALRPRELLFGKVIGIGITALVQASAIITAALVSASAVGSNFLSGKSPATAGWTAVWFLLGYAFYCSAYGAIGSLVSRQEDAQNASFPVQLPLLVAYFTSFSVVLGNDVSPLVRVFAFLPPTAPISMPALIGAGAVSTPEILLSLALEVAATALLVRVAGTIYARAILHTGRRLKVIEVLRMTD